MITFSQGGAAKIKSEQFSEFGSWTISSKRVPRAPYVSHMSDSAPGLYLRTRGKKLGGGGGGGGEQHCGLRMMALMQALETRPDCRHRIFVRTERISSKLIVREKLIEHNPQIHRPQFSKCATNSSEE